MKPMLVRAVLLSVACLAFPTLAQDADLQDPAAASAEGENAIDMIGTRLGQGLLFYGGIEIGLGPVF